MIKILLLEDDLLFAETLSDLLEENNFHVTHSPNGQDALNKTYKSKYDLYLLDINVPLIDGTTLLKELRDANDLTPSIFLTSHNDKEKMRESFLSGGDDFVRKPFDSDELLLRINAVLKRSALMFTCIGPLCHDEHLNRIYYNEVDLELSKKEYQLLLLLMKHANKTVPKELILSELWNNNESPSDGAIRVYINRIKQLLPQMGVENIRGVGYKLVS